MRTYHYKYAVDLKTLPQITKPFKIFRHPFSRAVKAVGLGRFLPGQSQVLSSSPLSLAYGANAGIHMGKDPYKLFQGMLSDFKSLGMDTSQIKPLSRSGRNALREIVKAHEGIEMHAGKKLLGNVFGDKSIPILADSRPGQMREMVKNFSSAAKDAVAKPMKAIKDFGIGISNNIKSTSGNLINKVKSFTAPGPPLPPVSTPRIMRPRSFPNSFSMRNKYFANKLTIRDKAMPFNNMSPKLKAAPAADTVPAFPASLSPMSKGQPDLIKKIKKIEGVSNSNGYFSHYDPSVLLTEGNILATVKGKGAPEAADYMRKIRDISGESKHINRIAKSIGMDDYDFGITRISRHKKKLLADAIRNDYHPKPPDFTQALDAMNT